MAASLKADWTREGLGVLRYLLRVVEGRARAQGQVTLIWPAEQSAIAEAAVDSALSRGASRRANGLLLDARDLFDTAQTLAESGVGPVTAGRPDYVFESACPAVDDLAEALKL